VEARRVLQQLPAGYLRRRVKAMVEKQARTRRLPAITAEVVEPFVRPELESLDQGAGPHRAPLGLEAHTGPQVSPRRLPWSAEAEERLARISAGFLRNLASEQIERLAIALHAPEVEILHAEAGIAEARSLMRLRRAARSVPAPASRPWPPLRRPRAARSMGGPRRPRAATTTPTASNLPEPRGNPARVPTTTTGSMS
jgi:hypothetical protein